MGQALYRKHRPKKLSEVVGQEHITKTLGQAIKQGRISHAYLLTGPRGVGKTSVARILAHEVNQLPYADDSAHIDIIEIDAASNRRIDEIRELRDKVYIAPTSAKYKVYIIDEVHMLTREAFNALLKTLEEPPEHVIFILATTDAHKLPETIISRTQRFSFKPVSKDRVMQHLQAIAEQEKITIGPEALALIAEHGEGSFRDSISLLDQASASTRNVEPEDVRSLLGLPSIEAIENIITLFDTGASSAAMMQAVDELYGRGYQAAIVAKYLGQNIRRMLIEGTFSSQNEQFFTLLQQLIEVPSSTDPDRFLEIVLLQNTGVAHDSNELSKESQSDLAEKAPVKTTEPDLAPAAPVEKVKHKPSSESVKLVSPPSEKPEKEEKPASTEVSTAAPPDHAKKGTIDQSTWEEALKTLKKKHNTLYGLVRMAEPEFVGDEIRLKFAFAFHQKRVSETANKQRLLDIIHELTGQTARIECVFDSTAASPAKNNATPEAVTKPEELSAISNIFGGGELLES